MTGVWSKSWICILLLLYIIHYCYCTGLWSKDGFLYCFFYITIELEYGAKLDLYTAPSIDYNPLMLKNWSMEQRWICILLLLLSIIPVELEYGAKRNLYTAAPSIIHYY